MAGIRPVFERGSPLTFSANVNIAGGQMVEPDSTTGRIKPAAADSAVCLGVATGDAAGYAFVNADTTDAWGNPIVNAQYPPNEVAVASQGVWLIKAVGAIAFGDLVAVATGSFVKTLGAGAFGAVVGQCVEPGGIADGALGKIRLGGGAG